MERMRKVSRGECARSVLAEREGIKLGEQGNPVGRERKRESQNLGSKPVLTLGIFIGNHLVRSQQHLLGISLEPTKTLLGPIIDCHMAYF